MSETTTKRAWLLHGTAGSNSDYFWFADTKQFLESKGYEVWWPLLPHTEKPELEETLNYVEDTVPILNSETVIIAHSSACPMVLSFLQSVKVELRQVILVSGFYQSLNDDGYSDLMLQKEDYHWNDIKKASKEIILINSDNDPWGCNDIQARPVAVSLKAALVIATGQGHMGSVTYNQPYTAFPLLKRLLP
jgi:predicted alpha/beta hydrolase family esterase